MYKTQKVVTDRSCHSYTAFIFTGNDDVETTLSLTCNIVACLESECSSLISECSRRKRRSAVPQNQQYTTTVTKVFRVMKTFYMHGVGEAVSEADVPKAEWKASE